MLTTPRLTRLRPGLPALGAALCLCLAACSGGAAPAGAPASPTAQGSAWGSGGATAAQGGHDDHGRIEGAEELDRAPASLAVLTSTGEVSVISLEDLSATPVATAPGATTVATDSRFLLLGHPDGSLGMADSGVWTQNHGDHQHYYRAQARDLGPLTIPAPTGAPGAPGDPAQPGPPAAPTTASQAAPALIASSPTLTAVTADGRTALLDYQDLEAGPAGTGSPTGTADTASAASPLLTVAVDPGSYAAPLGSRLVVAQQEQVRLLDREGTAVGESLACPQPSGGITTRAGVALGCRGGVVLASLPDSQAQDPVLEWVALPPEAGQDTQPSAFAGRAGRPGVAVLDSEGGWWLLDSRERTWSRPAEADGPPLVAVAALDDAHDRVVGVDGEGRVHLWSDGAHAAVTEPIASPGLAAATGIQLTADRAYLPAAQGDAVLEIDPAAGGEVERTVPAPGLLALRVVGV